MSSNLITADNGVSSGVTGITQSAGSDGTLQLRTTTSAGVATTAISISNTQAVSIQGLTVGLGNSAVSTNVAFGLNALTTNTTGAQNTAIGAYALQLTTSSSLNTAVGYVAGQYNTTGHITAVGAYALQNNTTGGGNTAVGGNDGTVDGPLYLNTTGSSNIAIGPGALKSNTTASYSTAVGYQAGFTSNHTADANGYNSLFGYASGYSLTTGNSNCLIGTSAGYSLTTGTNNTFVGANTGSGTCGYYVTTGSKNTILGGYNGNQGGVDIRTASNSVVISDGDGNPGFWWQTTGYIYLGSGNRSNDGGLILLGTTTSGQGPAIVGQTGQYGSTTSRWNIGSNSFIKGGTDYTTLTCLSGSGGGVNLTSGSTAWVSASDSRLKNVTGTYTTALADIAQIQPVKFTWKDDATNKPQVGVIAQSVQTVVPEAIDNLRHSKEDETEYLGVRYTELIPLMIASIQELSAELTALKAKVGA